MNTTNATKIAALRPGGSVVLSRGDCCYVTAERSGDGKTLRIVRIYSHGFGVVASSAFAGRR